MERSSGGVEGVFLKGKGGLERSFGGESGMGRASRGARVQISVGADVYKKECLSLTVPRNPQSLKNIF